MACLGIHYKATGDRFLCQPVAGHRPSRFNNLHSVPIPKLAGKSSVTGISTAATMTPTPITTVSGSDSSGYEENIDIVPIEPFVDVDDEDSDRSYENFNVSDKIDEWMKNSVTEIVKNIRQAPLLVQIYADGVVKTEKAVEAEDWPYVVNEKPSSSSSSSPDGIILVEELRDKKDLNEFDNNEEEGTKAFGVVIQGKVKGRDRVRVKSACYLLKTSSVNGGMGAFCTHFCLMKVGSFSKSAASQLNDCWLLP